MSTQNHQICSTALPSSLYKPHCPTNPTFPQKPIPSNPTQPTPFPIGKNEHLKSSNRQHIPYSFLCTHTTLPCKFPNPPKPKPTQKTFPRGKPTPKIIKSAARHSYSFLCFFPFPVLPLQCKYPYRISLKLAPPPGFSLLTSPLIILASNLSLHPSNNLAHLSLTLKSSQSLIPSITHHLRAPLAIPVLPVCGGSIRAAIKVGPSVANEPKGLEQLLLCFAFLAFPILLS